MIKKIHGPLGLNAEFRIKELEAWILLLDLIYTKYV